MKSLLRLARGFYGIWSQLRRLNRLLEHIVLHHPAFDGIGLPPTEREVRAAMEEPIETVPVDEEFIAGQRALEILRKRRKGERFEEGEPGEDWELF